MFGAMSADASTARKDTSILLLMPPNDAPSTDPVDVPDGAFDWRGLLGTRELAEGRVTTVEVGRRTLCVTNVAGSFGVGGRPWAISAGS